MLVQRYWRLLATYLWARRRALGGLALLVPVGIGLQLLGPQLIGRFLDAALADAAQSLLLGLAIGYILVGIGQRAANLGAIYVGENLGWDAMNALRADLMRHVLGLDLAFHKIHPPGELLERLDGDVNALANFFSQFTLRVLGNALLVGGILVLLWREDWRAGAALTIYAGVSLFALGAIQQFGANRWAAAQAALAAVFGFLEERLAATEDIRASGAERYTLRRFLALMHTHMLANRRARMAGNLAFAITSFLTTAGYAAGLAIGALLYLAGDVSIGGAFLIVTYVGMLAGPLERLRAEAQDLQQAGGAIERIDALLATHATIQAPLHPQSLPSGALELSFERVSFAYEALVRTANRALAEHDEQGNDESGVDLPRTLHEITLHLRPGETLGLLGRTGSGKSTISRLLLRLYAAQSGTITLGGHRIDQLDLADLRRRVGMVTQDVQIFHASVRDNLTLFDDSVADERIEAALRELEIWEWVKSLPDGLATLIGGAHGLSAGEAQLLAFARVLLNDPGLLILDEASSRLDPLSERRLERALDRVLAGRTAIVIAHRLRTVDRVDRIAVLEDGRIVEQGERAQLAADPQSRFARLLRVGLEAGS